MERPRLDRPKEGVTRHIGRPCSNDTGGGLDTVPGVRHRTAAELGCIARQCRISQPRSSLVSARSRHRRLSNIGMLRAASLRGCLDTTLCGIATFIPGLCNSLPASGPGVNRAGILRSVVSCYLVESMRCPATAWNASKNFDPPSKGGSSPCRPCKTCESTGSRPTSPSRG